MICPSCEHPTTKVVDSRPLTNSVYRRRRCKSCGYTFTTYEEEPKAKQITLDQKPKLRR